MNEPISYLMAGAFKVPTGFPESDGTAEWNSTTLILVELGAGKVMALGYAYAHEACVPVIRETLFPLLRGQDSFAIPELRNKMNKSVRNFGRQGIAASAMAAVEIALWDLKAKLLGVSVVKLLGNVRPKIPVYGSGGFISYSEKQLRTQLEDWAAEGIGMFKIKVGRDGSQDETRVKWSREAIGAKADLFVDANGAYTPKTALMMAEKYSTCNVNWFEEPVSSDDLAGLRFVNQHLPATMEVAAGEYNYDVWQARQMLEHRAVNVLQADVTRCGVTGFRQMAELCEAYQTPLSAHTAPALHAHLGCAVNRARHVEYFHDHVHIEQTLFEGPTVRHIDGFLEPDLTLPGWGLEFKSGDAEKYRIKI